MSGTLRQLIPAGPINRHSTNQHSVHLFDKDFSSWP